MASLYYLAEKCMLRLPDQNRLVVIDSVRDAYAVAVKREWYENKNDGTAEVDGIFLHTFKDVMPIYDESRKMYYIEFPSSYLRLPHQMGSNWISYMGDPNDFWLISNWSMWKNAKAGNLGGKYPYFIEGTRAYFPKMTQDNVGTLFLRMAIALDVVDPRQELNIPANLQSIIVDLVINKFIPQPVVRHEKQQ